MKAPQSTMKEFIDKSRVNVIKDSDKFENSIKTEEIIRHHTFFFSFGYSQFIQALRVALTQAKFAIYFIF